MNVPNKRQFYFFNSLLNSHHYLGYFLHCSLYLKEPIYANTRWEVLNAQARKSCNPFLKYEDWLRWHNVFKFRNGLFPYLYAIIILPNFAHRKTECGVHLLQQMRPNRSYQTEIPSPNDTYAEPQKIELSSMSISLISCLSRPRTPSVSPCETVQ
ncbi:hypothetical protein T07_8596 [Trichinella nelsoni]|uniref:Uncharacterized protein n=1 Tax=Trichinella nelsoni TaxID=6336 RepID=A0A0V0S0B8_9BILA|nr:hypothetical protein T07_8596 [Trichinella nelsoni]